MNNKKDKKKKINRVKKTKRKRTIVFIFLKLPPTGFAGSTGKQAPTKRVFEVGFAAATRRQQPPGLFIGGSHAPAKLSVDMRFSSEKDCAPLNQRRDPLQNHLKSSC